MSTRIRAINIVLWATLLLFVSCGNNDKIIILSANKRGTSTRQIATTKPTTSTPVASQPVKAAPKPTAQATPAPAMEEEKTYTMKLAHAQPTDNPRHVSCVAFKRMVETKTNGNVKVEIIPNGQLGTEPEMMDMVSAGTLQGYRGGAVGYVTNKLELLSMPFLTETPAQIASLCSSDIAKEICEGTKAKNIIVLALCDGGGYREFANNVRPIKTPADMVGLRMRTNGMDTMNRTFKALGAEIVSIPYGDLYLGLQKGDADGQENPWVNVVSKKLQEVQKYFTVINYQFHADPLYVNLDWWNTLPPEYQTVLQEAAQEMAQVNNQAVQENLQVALDDIKKVAEVYELTPEERQAFKDAVKPVYDQYIAEGLMTQRELDAMRAVVANTKQ